ncbi:MAG TPA: S8 family serine peptidase [Candidatus Sulfotelmatobacter sp.]|nr:S8 family serine peptidase [Candidatus Sulfotelmatobacter sp.]
MKRPMWLAAALLTLISATPAQADNRFIVRSTLGSSALTQLCLLQTCTVVTTIDGTLNQVFLLTTPSAIDPTTFLNLLRSTPGIVDAELDQVINLVGGLNAVTTTPAGLTDSTPVNYFGNTVWNGYANQPASGIVHVQDAQNTFQVSGKGIVADIDTGVDPNHPALKNVLLSGYDFTRNQPGGSEMTDFTSPSPSPCPSCQPAIVNQSTAAVLDQSTAAVLDGNLQYAAFGHGTMVMGVIHLVAPNAQLLPLKAFHSDGTGYLSDILRAIYYAAQNNANVINMSFDFKSPSPELSNALDYANKLNIICAASAGNDGAMETVYPAALQTDVMGVASTSDLDTRSAFSNFGNAIVWVAAPGEAIITTYPFSTYSAGWGTSFSAPFVSGGAALLRALRTDINQSLASAAIAHAQFVGADMGSGRLDLLMALTALPSGSASPDYNVAAAPSGATITAGQMTNFSVSAAPTGGFNQTITWTCTGAPMASSCSVSPASSPMDGSTAATSTATVMTTTRSSTLPIARPRFVPPRLPRQVLPVFIAWLLVALILYKLKRSQRARRLISASAVLVLAALCASCGGGGGGTNTGSPPPPTQGTPAGTYTITVTGTSGSLSHSASFQLVVK